MPIMSSTGAQPNHQLQQIGTHISVTISRNRSAQSPTIVYDLAPNAWLARLSKAEAPPYTYSRGINLS